jgi:hypothetical protein
LYYGMKGATVNGSKVPSVFVETGDLSPEGADLLNSDDKLNNLLAHHLVLPVLGNRCFITEIEGVEINLFIFLPLLTTVSLLSNFMLSEDLPILCTDNCWLAYGNIQISGGYGDSSSGIRWLTARTMDKSKFHGIKLMETPLGIAEVVPANGATRLAVLREVKEWYLSNKNVLDKFRSENPVRVFTSTGEKIFDNVPELSGDLNTKKFNSLDDKL